MNRADTIPANSLRRYWRPSPEDLHLLRAALLAPMKALENWRAWRAANDPLQVNDGIVKVLAQVLRNLQDAGLDGPEKRRLQVAILKAHAKARGVREGFLKCATQFASRGIPVIAFKGVILAPVYYPSPEARLMNDIDLLVHPKDAPQAVEILSNAGWAPVDESHANRRATRHSVNCHGDGLPDMDLHWKLMKSCLYEDSDEAFWERSVPCEVAGASESIRRLCPEDEFLLCCEHGVRSNSVLPLRWLVDAAMILRYSGAAFDHGLLIGEVLRRRLVHPVAETATILANEIGLPEARALDARMRELRPGLIERLQVWTEGYEGRYRWEMDMLVAYVRRARGNRYLPTPWGYIQHLAQNGNAGSVGVYLRSLAGITSPADS